MSLHWSFRETVHYSLAEDLRVRYANYLAMNQMLLSQIFIYPIKSARGIAVSEIQVDSGGPLQDRRWMVVDEEGLFLRNANCHAWS